MPKEFFSVNRCVSLNDLPKGGHVHVIGVCGVAMAQLAVALSNSGFEVSGSDKDFYEPMSSYLSASKVKLYRGFSADNVANDVQAVVIGNVVSYGHVEVAEVEKRAIPYTLFPKALYELIIQGKHSIVISGTHGKSTTTGFAASILERLGKQPSYFVGGVVRDLPESLHLSSGRYSVVEGDEYDSAFFAKVPKFSFYKPKSLVVTSIEYDHADIYQSLEAIEKEFTGLVMSLSNADAAVCCIDDENVARLAAQWRSSATCSIVTYGSAADADAQIIGRTINDGAQIVRVNSRLHKQFEFALSIPGLHNARNALGALLALAHSGVSLDEAVKKTSLYEGVKRRQEIRFKNSDVVLIEDFAHHPTAVRETLAALKEFYPGRKLLAVFEPRTNTSRRKVFQADYVKAFHSADSVMLCNVAAKSIDAGEALLDVAELSDDISATGVASRCFPDPASIEKAIMNELSSPLLIVLMSNGSFGGLPQSLTNKLQEKYQ